MNYLTCVLVGDERVGKTSLIITHSNRRFPGLYIPTIMGEYSSIVKVDKTEVNLIKIDTQATPKHDRLRPLCYSLADVFLVCFSIEDPDSYHNVAEKWIPEIRQYYPSVPVLLVGTKRDLRFNDATVTQLLKVDQNPIQYYQGLNLKEEINAKDYVECSALSNDDMDRVFEFAARIALKKSLKQSFSKSFCKIS